jgi:hypothetical protein
VRDGAQDWFLRLLERVHLSTLDLVL